MMRRGMLVMMAVLVLPVLMTEGADFIESVHAQGADIAKEMVVEGSQVVWSPFSVVNVLPLINGDDSLKTGFKSAIQHFKEVGGVQISRLTTLFTKESSKVEGLGAEYGVEVQEFPQTQVKETLEEKYREEFGVEAPPGLIPEALENVTQLFLTSLLVKAEWETPFKYAPKGRFFLNETHAVKARFMSNIGFYAYGEIPGVDAKILSIPLRNSSTTSLVLVVPNNSSALPLVSAQFAEAQVGSILDKLKKQRTQLTLPKITVDSQLLLQPLANVKIIQSGSIRFSYFGLDNRVSKIRRSSNKFQRTRGRKQDLKFLVNRPFLYLIFDTRGGVLNYGEVLLPQDAAPHHLLQLTLDEPVRLSQNAKSLGAMAHERGNALFQTYKTQAETFALAPLLLSNLLAAYALVASPKINQALFGTLDSFRGMVELSESILYMNSTSSNGTRIEGGNGFLANESAPLGTQVSTKTEEGGRTSGYAEYNYEVHLRSTRHYLRTFYTNERDRENVTFYEYIGHVKYIGLPVYDAKAILLFPSPSQSLLIFLPNERSGLHLVEDGLKDFTLSKLLCQMRDRHARVRLPHFTIQTTVDILPALQTVLGLQEIQLEGLGPGVKIQALTQNVSITVTGGKDPLKLSRYAYNKYTAASRRRPSTRINVDRPFVWYLLDKSGGTLAVGRLMKFDPKLAESEVVPPVGTPEVEEEEDPIKKTKI